jgi:hypothetical protein
MSRLKTATWFRPAGHVTLEDDQVDLPRAHVAAAHGVFSYPRLVERA